MSQKKRSTSLIHGQTYEPFVKFSSLIFENYIFMKQILQNY